MKRDFATAFSSVQPQNSKPGTDPPVHQAEPPDIVPSPPAPPIAGKHKAYRNEQFSDEPGKKAWHPPAIVERQAKERSHRGNDQNPDQPVDLAARSFHALVEKNCAFAIRPGYCARPNGTA